MKRNPHVALVASILALVLVASSADAAVFNVPPLTINTLTHVISPGGVQDCIFIPGLGYSSSGFSSGFATGDVVRVRIQAPTGKMFRVGHHPID